jgi:hypothetical protein
MPQKERPEEAEARRIVEAALSISLRFTDLNGGVDYQFEHLGRSAAMEVTRLTDARIKEGELAWRTSNDVIPAPSLRNSWLITTDEHPRYNAVRARLLGALGQLEGHGLCEYDESSMRWWLQQVPTLADAVDVLGVAKVVHAKVHATRGTDRVLLMTPMGGYTYKGPDSAAELISQFVHDTPDVLRKLGACAAAERHLFVWTDLETPGAVRGAFQGDRLPNVTLELPEEVSHLWIYDDYLGRGWRWDPADAWSWMPDTPVPET